MIKVKSKSFITQSIVQDGEKVCVMCSGSAQFGPQAKPGQVKPTKSGIKYRSIENQNNQAEQIKQAKHSKANKSKTSNQTKPK